MKQLRFRLTALADLAEIYAYIREDDPNAARNVLRRIRGSVTRLEDFPLSGRDGMVPGTHELVVPGLPYIVVYGVETDYVDIIAVFHTARDRSPDQ